MTDIKSVSLVFPHQLFSEHPALDKSRKVILMEEYLFFNQYKFHKLKLIYHRATMMVYRDRLIATGYDVDYIDAQQNDADVRVLINRLASEGVSDLYYCNPVDDWLSKRIILESEKHDMAYHVIDTPMFLNSHEETVSYFSGRKTFFQTDFYIAQRKKRSILLDEAGKPLGGKWSFDAENRKKYPSGKNPPQVIFPSSNAYGEEANRYVELNYAANPGDQFNGCIYPVSHHEAEVWLEAFLSERFIEFGHYEDAMVAGEHFLNHSVLTPMLNIGLLTPEQILSRALEVYNQGVVPLQSAEGFVRQILGWREFVRGVYQHAGSRQRSSNFWGFSRKIPDSFYQGSTGMLPVDDAIQKLNKNAYNHHIERLMILGNFMLLCEFDPDEVYKWFMEMYIDAYDWVMVPNVYGMSQFADGGLLATKPYISGSNYIMKMSDYPKGDWQKIWDGLFWRFMHVHREFFLSNPRIGMLVRTWDKMDEAKRRDHLLNAENYLSSLG